MKTCTNCPGATDHDTAHCPLRGVREAYDAWRNRPVGYVRPYDPGEWEAWQAACAATKAQWTADAEAWGDALNAAAWVFVDVSPEKSVLLFNTCKPSLRAAILAYAEQALAAAPAQGE